MADYTLYYAPGACSISPHIALIEAKASFDLVKVDIRTKKLADGGDWLAVNPKGYVPALKLPDGEILTEGAVLIQFIADHAPDARLAPRYGTKERYRLNETIHFIATEMHKGFGPLFNSLISDAHKTQTIEKGHKRIAELATMLHGKSWLGGDTFSIADGYAYYVLRAWQGWLKQEIKTPAITEYYARLSARPSVVAALAAEGLTP